MKTVPDKRWTGSQLITNPEIASLPRQVLVRVLDLIKKTRLGIVSISTVFRLTSILLFCTSSFAGPLATALRTCCACGSDRFFEVLEIDVEVV